MADEAPASRFAFLYRQSEGVLDAREWARAAWPPAAIALAIVVDLQVFLAQPGTPEPLSDQQLAGPTAVTALAFFIAYMLLAVLSIFFVLRCWRWRSMFRLREAISREGFAAEPCRSGAVFDLVRLGGPLVCHHGGRSIPFGRASCFCRYRFVDLRLDGLRAWFSEGRHGLTR